MFNFLNKKLYITLIPGFIIIAIFLIYYQPTKETMYCNKYYQCTIEQQYLWIIPIYRKVQLSKKSKIIQKITFDWARKRGGYKGYLNFTDHNGNEIVPFTYYLSSSRYYNDVENSLSRNQAALQRYLNNPNGEYRTSSNANGILLIIILLALFLTPAINKFRCPSK